MPAASGRHLRCLALALAEAVCAQGKRYASTVRIGGALEEQRWQYMGKFGYTLGEGGYELRLRLRPSPDVEKADPLFRMEVFLDEEWSHAESLSPCRRAAEGPARRTHRHLDAGIDGEFGVWEGGTVMQSVRPHIWYFALSNCEARQGSNITYEVDFELHANQFDGSELSFELRHMFFPNLLTLFCLIGFLAQRASHCGDLRHDVHPVIRALLSAVALQCAAQVLHTLHLWVSGSDGVGRPALDAAAEVLFMLSQVVTATLLIAMAQGYTLLHQETSESIKPVASLVTVLHVALVATGKLQGEASSKHHENEGLVGLALLAIRVVLLSWFFASAAGLRERGGARLHGFLKRFQLAGSVYFLAYPVIFMLAQVFAEYLRHPVMHLGLLAMQSASTVWLAELFLSRGDYFKLSSLSCSLLPGGAGGLFHSKCSVKHD